MVTRARLDAELVRRGLARSRGQAAELIEQGLVAIRGVTAEKAATVVDRDTPVTVVATADRQWASRGAHKLIGALDALAVRSGGSALPRCGRVHRRLHRRAARARSRAGRRRRRRLRAARLAAAQRRAGPGARPHERARRSRPPQIGGPVELTVADLSFISLRTVLPALAACTATASCCRW